MISSRLLSDGENVLVSTRTHAKALLLPVLTLVVLLVLGIVLAAVVGDVGGGVPQLVIWVILAAVAAWWVLRPVLRWLTTTYTFTDRRFIKRSGILSKEGRTIPLNRISGVDFEMGIVDRMFGCGTLVVSDASTDGRVELRDIPRVEQVQLRVAEQLNRLGGGERHHDGT